MEGPARNRVWLAIVVGLVVVGASLMGGAAAFATPAPSAPTHPTGPAAAVSASATPGQVLLSRGLNAIDRGEGPGTAVALNCATSSSTAATCASVPPARINEVRHSAPRSGAGVVAGTAHPLVQPDGPIWYNETDNMSYVDGTVYGMAAYDPDYNGTGTVLFYGGLNAGDSFNDNTWIYQGFEWLNISSTLTSSPGGVTAGGMDYDPIFGGVILATGVAPGDVFFNATWLFNSTGWYNITAAVNPFGYMPDSAYGTLAWDPAYQSIVFVDGCFDPTCASVWTGTWMLGTSWTYWGPGPGGTSLGLEDASMAFDAADQELVVFGGYFSGVELNSTWAFNGSGWTDLTQSSVGCFFVCDFYPPARVQSQMTWDGQENAIVMFGGFNTTTDAVFNDTWFFTDNEWFPAFAFYSGPAVPATLGGAMPVNSSDIAPVLIGGETYTSLYTPASLVFEFPPVLNITTLAPDPVDVGATESIVATVSAGTGSGPWVAWGISSGGNGYGGSVFGINFSAPYSFATSDLNYSAPGTYPVNATVVDYFWVRGFAWANVTVVAPVTLSIGVTPTTTEVGGSVTFTASPAAGVTPYVYDWTFGDGGTSNVASPSHVYASNGTFEANLTLNDSGGGSAVAHTTLTVLPALLATAAANVTSTDVGQPIAFTGSATGGSGTYSTYAWSFGDGSTASTASATHTFATPGTYHAVLNVTDSLGFWTTSSYTVLVNPSLAGAAISASPSSPSAGTTVTFGEVPTGGTTPYSYAWNFGDGSTGTGAAPTHSYSSSGTYTVTVTVSDARGGKATETVTVSVSAAPSTFSLTSGTGLYLILGVVIAIIVIAALVVAFRRRRSPGGSSPPSGASVPPPGAGGPPPPPTN
jgi:PKD repeat protein